MRFLAVIPARYSSQRLPAKPLANIAGRPLIQRVYEATNSTSVFDQVLVATDHEQIAAVVREFGGDVELSRTDHPSGTDRVAEVAQRHSDADVVVNVQGDQPFVSAEILEGLVAPFRRGESVDMTTPACPLEPPLDPNDPNVVKVVCDKDDRALYFSRSPIPHPRQGVATYRHHLGLYAFKREALLRFASLPPSQLELTEGLEQLRAVENGFMIKVTRASHAIFEVNTPEDVARAEELIGQQGTA